MQIVVAVYALQVAQNTNGTVRYDDFMHKFGGQLETGTVLRTTRR